MESLRVVPDLEATGFRDGKYAVTEHQGDVVVGGMARGTAGGNPVVMIGIEDPETKGYLVVQTTLALFLTAADVLKARHGDPRI